MVATGGANMGLTGANVQGFEPSHNDFEKSYSTSTNWKNIKANDCGMVTNPTANPTVLTFKEPVDSNQIGSEGMGQGRSYTKTHHSRSVCDSNTTYR